MSGAATEFVARARSDEEDRLVEADEPLASLQEACGGMMGERIAIPELLALVRKARTFGLRLSREVRAYDGENDIVAWIEVVPVNDGEFRGCRIGATSWSSDPARDQGNANDQLFTEIERHLAELSARLGSGQNLLSVSSDAPDLQDLVARMEQSMGRPWTEFVEFPELGHEQPMHWRILDGARCTVEGSERLWTASLVPLGHDRQGRSGFELYLTAETPLPNNGSANEHDPEEANPIGRDIAPILREPIGRIIENAETIRSRLAGPLKKEYSEYAADISDAAHHLLGLIDDLADLDAVESDSFLTAPDPIDLADAAKRAAGILGGKAQERKISLEMPSLDETRPAIAEFRRVMQVVLNLLGNALRYSPEGSSVAVELGQAGDFATISVVDQGPGLDADQQERVFEKFERLGRSGDGGSGLGLYISRRIARAMGGDVTVESEPGQGARFTLSVPTRD